MKATTLNYGRRTAGSGYGNQQHGTNHFPRKSSKQKTVEESGRWVTFNGNPVFIKTGETAIEAYERTTGKTFNIDTDELDVREGKVDQSVFKQEQVAREATAQIMAELPSEHIEGLTVRVKDDLGPVKIQGFEGAKVLADFEPDEFTTKKGILTVNLGLHGNSAKARNAIYHEVGHHVYRSVLSPEDRESWGAFWEANKVVMPNSYAESKASEGFAEAYANWQQQPGSMGPDVNRWFSKRLKWKG